MVLESVNLVYFVSKKTKTKPIETSFVEKDENPFLSNFMGFDECEKCRENHGHVVHRNSLLKQGKINKQTKDWFIKLHHSYKLLNCVTLTQQ